MNLTKTIKQKVIEIGFDLVGITDASFVDEQNTRFLRNWLDSGFAADMAYMHRNLEKRIDPAKLLEGAKSVICVAIAYKSANQTEPDQTPSGAISSYAQYQDYHEFIKGKSQTVCEFIKTQVGCDFNFKVCVDSVPLAERALAVRAGLGFIGKNHLLINPQLGPQLLLGEIITDLELDCDQPIPQNCSNCDACIKACPTGAMSETGIDCRKCISYLTIEHKGDIPAELASKIGNSLFGCDRCMLACPYTSAATATADILPHLLPGAIKLEEIFAMTPAQFDERFSHTAIHRLGLARLIRNARVCQANLHK